MVLVVAGLLLTGCASTTPSPRVTVTATPSAAFSVIIFNPVTSGKDLATRIAARAKLKTATDTITNVERKNFANITVGTHTDCQMQVNGVKRGFRATFTQSDGGGGHYVVVSQKLTWWAVLSSRLTTAPPARGQSAVSAR